jgi:hypothetical protein
MKTSLVLSALLVAVPATTMAQGDSASTAAAACAKQQSGLVLNETFSSTADFGRVLLCAGASYKAETNRGGVRLSARALLPGVQSPRITELMGGNAAGGVGGGGAIYKLLAYADGVYEIRVSAVQAAASVTLRITRTN